MSSMVRSLLARLWSIPTIPTTTSRRRAGSRIGRSTFRPAVECLEDRLVPTGKGVISGFALQDVTGNGMSPDDTALRGVKINLYQDTNRNGTLDCNDCLLTTQNTATDGSYAFGKLNAGKYFVEETSPANTVRTAPTTAAFYTINLAANQTAAGNNFDNFQKCNTGAITNISFTITGPNHNPYTVTDLRGHTRQGDTVTANFKVTGTSKVLVTLVTYDAPGASFDAHTAGQQYIVDKSSQLLSPGKHSLTVHLPNNFYQVDFVCGAAIDHLGPAGSNIFYSAQCRLLSADNEGTQAFAPGTVSGVVYNDVNYNAANGTGVYNPTIDAPLAGVTVTLTGTNILGQSVLRTAVTNANGVYAFTGLREGTYTVVQTTPPLAGFEYEQSNEVFALGGTATPGQIAGITVTHGALGGNYNLPQTPIANPTQSTAQLSGTVRFDSGDGTGNYSGLGGVELTLTDNQGHVVQTVTTSNAATDLGTYHFDEVPPGTYTISITSFRNGFSDESAQAGSLGGSPNPGVIANITVPTGDNVNGTGYDFLEQTPIDNS